MLPEPHIPDIPEVSGIPKAADISDVTAVPADMDVPDVAAVAGAMVPIVVPPPSKVAVDPNIPDGEVPVVEHVVPLPGTAIVPVTPVGSGLSPGDASSVAPRGMPVGDTVEPVPRPSGEVAPIVGVGAAIPPTCAMATLQTKSAGRTTAIDEIRIGIPRSKAASMRPAPGSIDFTTILLGARLSDTAQPIRGAQEARILGLAPNRSDGWKVID